MRERIAIPAALLLAAVALAVALAAPPARHGEAQEESTATPTATSTPTATAEVAPGEYSMELDIAPSQAEVGSTFTVSAGIFHDGGSYQMVQWDIDYDESLISIDLASTARDAAAPDACLAKTDNGSRVLLGCIDVFGPNLTYSGNAWNLVATCTGDGIAIFNLQGVGSTTYVKNASNDAGRPVHARNDRIQCGIGGPEPTHTPAATPAGTATPEPARDANIVISSGGAFGGRLLEDTDGDRAISAADRPPVETLVELAFISRAALLKDELPSRPNLGVLTKGGEFRFESIPAGVYTLWVWWAPGFLNAEPWPTNPGLFFAEIRVAADGTVSADRPVPKTLLVRPLPAGQGQAYPVRASGARPASGVVNVSEALAGAAALPVAGTGGGGTPGWLPLAADAGAFGLAAAGVASLRRRRAHRA